MQFAAGLKGHFIFPTAVLIAITPVLMGMPINKHLEAACKEAAKEIQKKAKSTPAKKLLQMADGIACKQAGKVTQTATKVFTGLGEKQLDKIKKDAEKDIEKRARHVCRRRTDRACGARQESQ